MHCISEFCVYFKTGHFGWTSLLLFRASFFLYENVIYSFLFQASYFFQANNNDNTNKFFWNVTFPLFFKSFFPFSLHSANPLHSQAVRHTQWMGVWKVGSNLSSSTLYNMTLIDPISYVKFKWCDIKINNPYIMSKICSVVLTKRKLRFV